MCEIADNGFNLGWCKGSALDLGADGIEAFGGGRGTYRDQAAGRLGEAPERRLGEADFIGADQRVFVRDQQRCQQDFSSCAATRPVSRLIRRTFSCGRDLSVLVSSAI